MITCRYSVPNVIVHYTITHCTHTVNQDKSIAGYDGGNSDALPQGNTFPNVGKE